MKLFLKFLYIINNYNFQRLILLFSWEKIDLTETVF